MWREGFRVHRAAVLGYEALQQERAGASFCAPVAPRSVIVVVLSLRKSEPAGPPSARVITRNGLTTPVAFEIMFLLFCVLWKKLTRLPQLPPKLS